MSRGMKIELSDWRRTRSSIMIHQPTGMYFYLLHLPSTQESAIEVDRMAYKPTHEELKRLQQEALYAFDQIEEEHT